MEKDADWKIGTHWTLKATFYSDSVVDRTMGFAGPQGGFLSIKVPGGVQAWTTRVAGPVKQAADKLEFQRLGVNANGAWLELGLRYLAPGNWTAGQVYMTDICLTPRSCGDYQCPAHSKSKGSSVLGYSEVRCCEKKLCQEEEVTCPEGKYTPHELLGQVSVVD